MVCLPLRGGRTLRNATEHHRSKTIEVQLAGLPNLNRTKLRELWRDSYGSDPPEKISDLLLRQAIAPPATGQASGRPQLLDPASFEAAA